MLRPRLKLPCQVLGTRWTALSLTYSPDLGRMLALSGLRSLRARLGLGHRHDACKLAKGAKGLGKSVGGARGSRPWQEPGEVVAGVNYQPLYIITEYVLCTMARPIYLSDNVVECLNVSSLPQSTEKLVTSLKQWTYLRGDSLGEDLSISNQYKVLTSPHPTKLLKHASDKETLQNINSMFCCCDIQFWNMCKDTMPLQASNREIKSLTTPMRC